MLAARTLQHELGAARPHGVTSLLRCRDCASWLERASSRRPGELSTETTLYPEACANWATRLPTGPRPITATVSPGVRSAELQADGADLAEAGKGRYVEADPGPDRHTDVLAGVEPHHPLMRGVRENVRSDDKSTVAAGGKDGSGHGIARMEWLARTSDGRERSEERVSTVVGKLGAGAYDTAAALYDDFVWPEVVEINDHLLELDAAGLGEDDARREVPTG